MSAVNKFAANLIWLQSNPEFDEKPATILEFLGPDYLGVESKVRPKIKQTLVEIFGTSVSGETMTAGYERAMITGGIGIGKTTFASIVLPYMAHWCLCLKDPQDFFNLLAGSRIAFMMMSTSESQAREVLFGDVVARIEHSPWFSANYPKDPNYKNQIRFPKDIWIIPGDSAETTFEGYNILGGILDEADSHKVTKVKDYAESGYNTIEARIQSRFQDRGFLIVIGQMKKATGFASKIYDQFCDDEKAYATRMTIWESLGWEKYTDTKGNRMSFFYDTKRKKIIPKELMEILKDSPDIIEVPLVYEASFRNDPEKALRDLAGIPPKVGDPFISLVDKIESCSERWLERNSVRIDAGANKYIVNSPIDESCTSPRFAPWFRCVDPLRRAVHLDIAYSAEGDAATIVMGHVPHMVEIEGELKPYIAIDCMIRIKAAAGTEIIIQDLRRKIYHMKDDLGFKITTVTMDGFQSQDTMQQLKKRRFKAEYLSVDRSKMPYEDLREAIYEERIEFPKYMTQMKPGDSQTVEIAIKELMELSDVGMKIDHPKDGSKDVADGLAGVCYTLMGDRQYKRKSLVSNSATLFQEAPGTGVSGSDALRLLGGLSGGTMPVPPSAASMLPPGYTQGVR